jgi:hypothetical protein
MASPVSSEMIAQIRTCLGDYIIELEQERDQIGSNSSAEYRSHDEMMADDLHWDEIDAKVVRISQMMVSLDSIPVVAAGIATEEISERVKKIQALLVALMVPPPIEEDEGEEDEEPAHRYDADGFDMDANYGACGYICEGDCDDCRWRADSHYSNGGGFDLADEI